MDKKKRKTIILVVVFAACIALAAVAYNSLSAEVKPGPQLSVAEGKGQISAAPAGTEENAAAAGEAEQAAEEQKTKAPDFTVLDEEGNEVKLSDMEGKPVVLNFWASWCPPCKQEMPEFQTAFEEMGGEVQFMMVDQTDGQRETVASGAAYVAEQGYTFPVYFDTELEGAIAYGVNSIPQTYFIDAEGYIAAAARGAIDAQTLREGIALING